jgi:hypothetical protein
MTGTFSRRQFSAGALGLGLTSAVGCAAVVEVAAASTGLVADAAQIFGSFANMQRLVTIASRVGLFAEIAQYGQDLAKHVAEFAIGARSHMTVPVVSPPSIDINITVHNPEGGEQLALNVYSMAVPLGEPPPSDLRSLQNSGFPTFIAAPEPGTSFQQPMTKALTTGVGYKTYLWFERVGRPLGDEGVVSARQPGPAFLACDPEQLEVVKLVREMADDAKRLPQITYGLSES